MNDATKPDCHSDAVRRAEMRLVHILDQAQARAHARGALWHSPQEMLAWVNAERASLGFPPLAAVTAAELPHGSVPTLAEDAPTPRVRAWVPSGSPQGSFTPAPARVHQPARASGTVPGTWDLLVAIAIAAGAVIVALRQFLPGRQAWRF